MSNNVDRIKELPFSKNPDVLSQIKKEEPAKLQTFSKMRYFKVILPKGHMGTGQYRERVHFAKGWAVDAYDTLMRIRKIGAVKIKHGLRYRFDVKEVKEEECLDFFRSKGIRPHFFYVRPFRLHYS